MSFITKKLEEFDERFPKVNYDKDATYIPDYEQYQKLKSFLSTALDEMIKEVEVKVKNLIREEGQEEVLDNTSSEWIKVGYNKALRDVKQSLSSLREGNK